MKPTLYLETTIPSYYTARLGRDVIVLAHQEITRMWWEQRLSAFEIYISPVVLEEARQGDQEAARKRLDVLARFSVLKATSAIERLAETYIAILNDLNDSSCGSSCFYYSASICGLSCK